VVASSARLILVEWVQRRPGGGHPETESIHSNYERIGSKCLTGRDFTAS
jgi:hypothetical protein